MGWQVVSGLAGRSVGQLVSSLIRSRGQQIRRLVGQVRTSRVGSLEVQHLVGWLASTSVGEKVSGSVAWLGSRLIRQKASRSGSWLGSRLIRLKASRSVSWLDRLVDQKASRSVGQSVSTSVGQKVSRLVGWLGSRLEDQQISRQDKIFEMESDCGQNCRSLSSLGSQELSSFWASVWERWLGWSISWQDSSIVCWQDKSLVCWEVG